MFTKPTPPPPRSPWKTIFSSETSSWSQRSWGSLLYSTLPLCVYLINIQKYVCLSRKSVFSKENSKLLYINRMQTSHSLILMVLRSWVMEYLVVNNQAQRALRTHGSILSYKYYLLLQNQLPMLALQKIH